MTEYVVLRTASLAGTGGSHDGWEHVRSIEASSARSAVSQIVNGTDSGEGEYVAIPARSWKPVTVKVETKTALRFS